MWCVMTAYLGAAQEPNVLFRIGMPHDVAIRKSVVVQHNQTITNVDRPSGTDVLSARGCQFTACRHTVLPLCGKLLLLLVSALAHRWLVQHQRRLPEAALSISWSLLHATR